jgi:CHAT domain-containing protein
MVAISISGKVSAQDLPQPVFAALQSTLRVTCQREITLETTVRTSGRFIELADSTTPTLLELEFDGGYKRWMRWQALHDYLASAEKRANPLLATAGKLILTATSFDAPDNNATLGLVLKCVRVLQIDAADDVQTVPPAQLIQQLETWRVPNPGLYRCADPNALQLQPVTPETLAIDPAKPVLLFLHGAFANTDASFGEWWESRQGYNASAYLQRLFAPYGQQVFTLEHHTLGVSPIQNAVQVLRLLPPQTRLHIISHARGGLVGELLCQAQLQRRTRASGNAFVASDEVFTAEELQAFATPDYQADWQDLQAINQLCQQKSLQVERFARVACPARGTVLAAACLEDHLSLVYNVLNLIPAPRFQQFADYVRMVLMAVTTANFTPDKLVGLAAMPTAPLVRLLNRPQVRLDSDLSIIAGSVKSSSLLGRLKPWATQCFAGDDHDYVVSTAAMYGGAQRLQGSRYYVDQRDDSHHFAYFRDALVRDRILNALQRPTEDTRFTTLTPAIDTATHQSRGAVSDSTLATVLTKKSTLYFIPGFMGSNLSINAQPVWLDVATLAWGDFTRLTMDAASVTADGVLETAYRPLLDVLDAKHRVVPFAWDWRRSVVEAGRRLGEAFERELNDARDAKRKLILRVLAHAAGGLLVQAMCSEMPNVWQRLQAEADFRLVFLGTPFNGTFAAVQLLLGQHRLLTLLNLLDGQADAGEARLLQAQFASYPALLELLPTDYLQESAWQALLGDGFATWAARPLLADALRVRQQLQAVTWDARYCLYVHGRARLTPDGVERIDAATTGAEQSVTWRFHASSEGDGVTLWKSLSHATSNTRALPVWYMPVEHGRMASRPDQFANLQYLLDDGVSRQLDQSPPQTEVSDEWLASIRSELFPDENELLAAALGYHTRLTQEEVRSPVEVRVVHGNLENTCHPVVVGHYEGDAILSAEAVLDNALNGRLSELLRVGLYPGALGTSHVFLNAGKKPGGAVVMGLGEVGKLTAGQLTAGFARAMLDYTVAVRESLERNTSIGMTTGEDSDFVPVHIATLLIGTVGGGSMTLADTITAVFRAITQANLVLNKTERGTRLRLQVIEFIELYEDRAVEAARLVQDFVLLPEFRRDFALKSLMKTAPGYRQRVTYNDPPGWWRRIQIEANQNGLKYITLTDKARAELLLQATQRKLVDQFIEKAEASSQQDAETGKILFELLLPPEMKEQAPNAENVVFVLDTAAAMYPWELLYNRLDVDSQPLAVRVGMLRQLQVGQYRQRVLNPLERSALVIGDPPTDGAFPRLEAAHQEAVSVANVLEAGGFSRVVRQIATDPQSILRALHSCDYRVMHLAGHGVYQYQPDENSDLRVSGMVLGDGIFLTPVEIGQMRRVPEFAFINCCHLAKMAASDETDSSALPSEGLQDRSRLAASLAQELIRMGVRAVIAAGWAINDAAAKVFAETCYGALLQGYTFGVAVLMARRETWEQYPNSNTWGAYQCYGDPDYKLLSRQPDSDTTVNTGDPWRFVAEVEVIAELHNLISAADIAKPDDAVWLQNRLQQLHRAIPAEWLNHAGILYALGCTYGKLDQFALAIEAYDAALDSPQADYPVVLLEDKVSLQTAWALAWSQGKVAAPPPRVALSPAELMAKSLKILQLLDGLGNSLERFSEEGKFWKRQALLVNAEEREQALKNMELAYQKAHEFAVKETGNVLGYPLIAWLTAKVVRYLRGDTRQLERPVFKYWLGQARQCADYADRQDNHFCSGITRAECSLLQYLYYALGARLDETNLVQNIISDYETAIARGAAPRQLRFVGEHIVFLRLMLEEYRNVRPALQPIVLALLAVETQLGIN